ncbi:MAG: hypothetical protein WBF58_17715 [Xanthobacteraceae bacterium]
MSTTTNRAAPSTIVGSSLATSSKFKAFATTFSISGPVVYCLTVYLNWPVFTFWPANDRFAWGLEAKGEGPNMLWYGWTLTAILISAGLGIIAMMLPERVTRKIPLALVWIFPILSIPFVVYSLMFWWRLAFKG